MFEEKEYIMAREAVDFINSCLDDEHNIPMIADAIYWLRQWDPKRSINEYAMEIAALSLYEVADNGQWWTPGTRKILENYRKVKKELKKGKKIYSTYIVTGYTWADSEYIKIRIA